MHHPFSYKDRAGFLFYENGILYRQINKVYQQQYNMLMDSGLYDELVAQKKLIAHTTIDAEMQQTLDCFMVIKPKQLDFISYPYEWCFAQLKQAALHTLQIMQASVAKGLVLKDATPYNVQFYKGKPIFIDTLSFEIYDATKPWVAYYQFCETFLYPLLLEYYNVQEVHKIFTIYPNGIPSENVVKLLPKKCKYSIFNYLHLYLLNKVKHKKSNNTTQLYNYSKQKMLNLVEHLMQKIVSLELPKLQTEWNNYYDTTIINQTYLQHKKQIVENWAADITNKKVLDIGCNDGVFSVIMAKQNNFVFATDYDVRCINKAVADVVATNSTTIQPMVLDIMHPSTNQGFFNTERKGFFERTEVEVVLMLAVIHHLVITKNLTFAIVASQLQAIAQILIIEYVPKQDEKVQQLLTSKEDVFADYAQEYFENDFSKYYTIIKTEIVQGSERTLYLMHKKN